MHTTATRTVLNAPLHAYHHVHARCVFIMLVLSCFPLCSVVVYCVASVSAAVSAHLRTTGWSLRELQPAAATQVLAPTPTRDAFGSTPASS